MNFIKDITLILFLVVVVWAMGFLVGRYALPYHPNCKNLPLEHCTVGSVFLTADGELFKCIGGNKWTNIK